MFNGRGGKASALAAMAMVAVLVVAACSGGSSTPGTASPGAAGGQTIGTDAALAALEGRLGSVLTSGGSQQTGIWVNGAGTVKTTPDVVVLSFGVVSRGEAVAVARAEAAQAMTDVLASVQANGVVERDIQTTGFRIQPITVFEEVLRGGIRQREPRIIGYEVSNSATAKIRLLDTVGVVIDEAAEAGGNTIRINGISFTVDNPKPIEVEARDLAIRDAMAKATQVAGVAGVTLGPPVFISEQSSTPFVQEAIAFRADAAGAPATPIIAGELDVTIRVQVVFSIL